STANNRAVPDEYPYHLNTDWLAYGFRATRIVDLINQKKNSGIPITTYDMKAMQLDIKSQMFNTIKLVLTMNTNTTFEYNPNVVNDWKNRLLQWNGYMETGSREASLFEEWLSQLWYLPSKEAN